MYVRGFYGLSPDQQRALNPNNYPIDAYGQVVSPTQETYLAAYGKYPTGGGFTSYAKNPYYNSNAGGAGGASAPGVGSPAPVAVQYQITFDTIGQTIFRTIGHCRLPLRMIWAQGIEASGDLTTSSTMSFAAALCAPFDPDEEGTVIGILSGNTVLFGASGTTIPPGMSDTTAALLTASLAAAQVFPGDEAQQPCSLIVADKGASVTNAFRGIRYIVFPAWPLDAGLPTNLSIDWQRTNAISPHRSPSPPYSTAAVEFAAGSA